MVASFALQCTADEAFATQQVNRCHASSSVIEGWVEVNLRIWLLLMGVAWVLQHRRQEDPCWRERLEPPKTIGLAPDR